MHSAEEERTDQQRRHTPECPEQERIFLRIMVSRMGQISCKATRRSRMAFLARPDNILTTEVRTRIRNREDIVRAMAIIALCRLGISKLRHLAVISVEVSLRDRFVTAAALSHNFKLKAGRIDPPDRMCRMAIAANRQWFVCLSDFLCVDARFKLLFNTMVTASARLRDIARIHARERIALGEHAVRSVTARACGSDGQPALHQPFAVDALCVMLDYLMLRTGVPGGGFLTFAMTFRAKQRNVRGKRRRVRAQLAEDIMRPVTLLTCRSVGVILRRQLPVRAYLELLTDFGVTRRAINFLRDRFARSDVGDTHL